MADIDYKQVTRFYKAMEKLGRRHEADNTLIQAVDQVSHRAQKRISNITKAGKYKGGKVGGTLKRSWMVKKATKRGGNIEGGIYTNIEYAPYVEFGHRTRLGAGKTKPKKGGKAWVEGKKYLDKVIPQTSKEASTIIQNAIVTKLKEVIK